MRAGLGEEKPVRLEADPTRRRHVPAGAPDELFQVRVEERLADAVQDQRFEVGKGGGERLEQCRRHLPFGHPATVGLLDAHDAAEVAAGGRLDEKLGGMGGERGTFLYS